uniref:Uncharacterized protein n=1 Tax=Rhodosorus marinus TaxID=101924 RepID=A0A7S0BLC8_9RHOD|mmetsp:Transcript_2183/g.3246  ORF Transcript_2183/g.3246 Transcript_2183/m.3246 type:complete len:201 (+) Transcript_2183:474-1076(+)
MNSLALYFCTVLFLCVVSVEAQTCEDAANATGSVIFDVTPVEAKLVLTDGDNPRSVGIVSLSRDKGTSGELEACVRMKFIVQQSLSLVSIRGGIFSKKEIIPAPVEYPNRRNVAKVLVNRGLPAGTELRKLSLVICDDEIPTDEDGCCRSPLAWIAHAIVRNANGELARAEVRVSDDCPIRVDDGPDVAICEVAVICVET